MAEPKPGDVVKGATVVRATAKVVEFTCECSRPSVKSLYSWDQARNSVMVKRITCKRCARKRCKAAANNAGLGNSKEAV